MNIKLEFDEQKTARAVKKCGKYILYALAAGLLLFFLSFAFRASFWLASIAAIVSAFFLVMLWAEYVLGGRKNPYSYKNDYTKGDAAIGNLGTMLGIPIVWFIFLLAAVAP